MQMASNVTTEAYRSLLGVCLFLGFGFSQGLLE